MTITEAIDQLWSPRLASAGITKKRVDGLLNAIYQAGRDDERAEQETPLIRELNGNGGA